MTLYLAVFIVGAIAGIYIGFWFGFSWGLEHRHTEHCESKAKESQ